MTPIEFDEWLETAERGDKAVYYRSTGPTSYLIPLACARKPYGWIYKEKIGTPSTWKPHRPEQAPTGFEEPFDIHWTAVLATDAFAQRKVFLYQVRNAEKGFDYVAQRR